MLENCTELSAILHYFCTEQSAILYLCISKIDCTRHREPAPVPSFAPSLPQAICISITKNRHLKSASMQTSVHYNYTLMERLQQQTDLLLRHTNTSFHRYMYDRIDWQSHMIGLTGPRGVGKTTMLLQHIKERLPRKETLYVSLDDLYFSVHNLVDLANAFRMSGGKYLFIDEVHKYAEWSRELKLIYDLYPELKVVFTGSSVLDISKGSFDLSRRAVMYSMQGLSFREYLELFHGIRIESYTLTDIVSHKVDIPSDFHPLAFFPNYLESGYYPFFLRNDHAQSLIMQVVEMSLMMDIPQFAGTSIAIGRKLKHLLEIIARSVPFKPNMSGIAQSVGASRNAIPDFFVYLEESGFISQLRNETGGIRGLGKVEKVYLDNPNLIYALGKGDADVGNIRETFFMNQTRVLHDPITSSVADFSIDDCTFEIGGPNKKQRQIRGTDKAYIVKDGIETGWNNVIPLWQFGLMY